MKFSHYLTSIKEERKLSLRAFAEQADISPSYMHMFLTGTRMPNKLVLVKLIKKLKLNEAEALYAYYSSLETIKIDMTYATDEQRNSVIALKAAIER